LTVKFLLISFGWVVDQGRRGGRPAGSGAVDPFAALADPTRRLLLERLATGEKTAGELADGLSVSQAAVSQHLRTLRDTGLVSVRADGRHRRYRLRQEAFADLREWLDGLDRFWKERVDALGHHLDREARDEDGHHRQPHVPASD
jgi:DNA-binding transcriptional ArsR family regulator